MADFCQQCALEILGEDDGDLAHISSINCTEIDLYAVVLCEGCGVIQVDHDGRCVSVGCLRNHVVKQ